MRKVPVVQGFRSPWPFLAIGLGLLVLLVSFVGAAFGQASTGTLAGTITDMKGLAMAGVSVLVHSEDTGVDQKPLITNDSGLYTVPLLPPGNYDVTASQTGFATVQHKGISLQVGQTLRIDMEMPVATQQSLVTVTTEAPLIETEKTEQSQNVSEDLVSNIPVSSRRWEQFVLLTAGATQDSATGLISFHGISSLYNNNSVDGANNNNAFQGGSRGAGLGTNGTATVDSYVYSADSIKEFQVSTNSYTAELGQAAGGAVNAVTKSGTSQFHGDLFYNMRNPIFNAFDPVSKTNAALQGAAAVAALTQPVHQQNQWGGSLGGRIIKDKLFFFVTDDGYRKVTPIVYTTSTPNILGLACPTAIGGNADPRCTNAKNFILNQNLGTFPRLLRQDIELVKLDYQLNQANHVNVVANIRDWKEPNGTATASANNSGVTTAATSFLQDRFIIANWTSVISNNKVNELRYQWGLDKNFAAAYSAAPGVKLSNIFTYGSMGTGDLQYVTETRNQISDNFSFTKGTHAFKAGVDLNFIHEQVRSSNPSTGAYSYSSAVGKIAGCPGSKTGLIFCDWLVDLYGVSGGAADFESDGKTLIPVGQHYTSFIQVKDQRFPGNAVDPGAFASDFTDNDYAGYFEDTWKARPNLTINAGVRYDVQMIPQPTNPNTHTPLTTYYTSTMKRDFGGIQPRVGVAWNFAKNTVFRAGGGIFFAKTPATSSKSAIATSGTREQNFQCQPPAVDPICGPLTFPNLLFWQQTFLRPAAPFAGTSTPAVLNPAGDACNGNPNCLIRGFSPDALRPRAYEAEAAIERQLPGHINFSASYVLTRGVHLPSHYDGNIAPTTLTKTYDILSANSGSPSTLLTSTVPFYTFPNQKIEATTGPTTIEFTSVNSLYNALVLTARRPMSHDIELLVNYTLSKATDDGEGFNSNGGGGTTLSSDGVLDPYNRQLEHGYSGIDNRNHFTTSVVWTPMLAKNLSSKAARGLLDGWALSSAITASSGTRYSGVLQSSAVQSLSGVPGIGGGMTGAVDLDSGGGGRAAWLPRDSFVLPSYANVDVRVAKQFTVHEHYNFELRGEAFNLINSTLVLAVNTTGFAYVTANTGVCTGHANTCMVPVDGFQAPTTTTAGLLGARQLQFGFRFGF